MAKCEGKQLGNLRQHIAKLTEKIPFNHLFDFVLLESQIKHTTKA